MLEPSNSSIFDSVLADSYVFVGASKIWLSFQLQAFDWKESHFFEQDKMPRIFFKRNGLIFTLAVASLVFATSAIGQEPGKTDLVQWPQEDVTPEAHYKLPGRKPAQPSKSKKKNVVLNPRMNGSNA